MSAKKPAPAAAPPKRKAMYVGSLATAEAVRREAARLYKEVRRSQGETLSVDDGYKLVSMLQMITKLIEVSDTERRLEALESAQRQSPASPPSKPRTLRVS